MGTDEPLTPNDEKESAMGMLVAEEITPFTYYKQMPWQAEDIATALKNLHDEDRAYSANWSEMGCFKTTTGLWLVDEVIEAQAGNVLICTTKSGKGTYLDAIPRVYTNINEWQVFNVDAKGIWRVDFLSQEGDWLQIDSAEFIEQLVLPNTKNIVLAHYQCFDNRAQNKDYLRALTQVDWEFVCLDEAHRIKNRHNQWTVNLKRLNAKYRHVMTGTGFINDPSEIWSLLHFLDKNRFGSYWRFRRHFCEEIKIGGFDKVVGVKNADEFRELRKSLGPRRMMAEVHKDIPEPIFTPSEVDLNATQRRMYNDIKTNLRTMDQQGIPIHSPNVLSQLNRLRQICVATPELVDSYFDPKQQRLVQSIRLVEPSSKLDRVMEILEDAEWDDESRQQFVVFSNFKDPLELLKVRLDAAEIPYIHMDESDDDNTRYTKWHDLWPQKNHRVFLCTLQLGSESINLSSAHHCIFLDRSWSPKDNNQGVSRVYRPGQTEAAQIIHINAKGTTDQRIEKINEIKGKWFNEIFGD